MDPLNVATILLAMQEIPDGAEQFDAFKHEHWPEDDPKHPMHLMHITEKTYNQIGLSLMTDVTACEMLAVTYEFGMEALVLDKKLNYLVRLAQKKLNIYGGEVPNAKLLPLLQEKLRDVSNMQVMYVGDNPLNPKREYPAWLIALSERFNFRLPSQGSYTFDGKKPKVTAAEKMAATVAKAAPDDDFYAKRGPKPTPGKISMKGGKLRRG